ncbi:EAL domain-containing protein [Amaricoccus sp.]|uniref:putative bifunctional diguanylate cyclase/phosphodiesterase n=1 Tax=Amaricoccus sp. TaxID=1872485 RepID=UPI001B4BC8D0|nr:EAL domain-containing protein [Amaricoccus sp.]MBP7003752.1 EAL domain-containing protein [Amaricoccus sp.]
MDLDRETSPSPSADPGLRPLARLAAVAAGAPWGVVAPREGAVWSGDPPAGLAAGLRALPVPAEGCVAVAAAPGGGFAAVAAIPGGLGVVAAAGPERIEADAAARADLVELGRLAGRLLREGQTARERDRMRRALDYMDQGLLVVEPDLSVPVLSRRTAELLQLPEEFLATRPSFPEIIDYQYVSGAISAETVGAWFNAYIVKRESLPETDVYERETFDGKTLEVRTTLLPGGGFARTFTDQTARRRREAAIAAADAENRRLFDNMTIGLYRADPEGRPVRANLPLARLNGFDTVEAFLEAAVHLRDLDVAPGRLDEFLRRLRRDGRVDDFVSQVRRLGTGELIWVAESAWAIRDEAGEIIGFEGAVVDTSARRRNEEETARLAWQDALTGLNNRSSFVRQLADALAAGERVAVLLLDLDRFKAVNDTLGHLAGDDLLRIIGTRIAALAGPGDVAARLGGDEFAMVVRDVDAAGAAVAAERALEAVRAPATIAGREVALGASIGVALAPQDGDDPTGLMKAADMALYRAKGEGRYAWRSFAPEMAAEVEARQRLELDLRAALERGELALAYQPVIDAEAGTPVGYEALMRWTHAEHGRVPAEEFIAIAEEARLIGPIGAWALARACADAAGWPRGRDLWVNVSAVQLAHGAFEEELDAALAASGFPPRRLVLEITETSLMEGRSDLAPLLRRLRARGVRIALDDFGTGYSSLGYLRRFPFDVIKIDRSFVRDLDEPETAAIVMSVLDLSRRLGIATVAEGVENERQLDALRAAHCGFVQGHLFGPALDAATIGKG